jgi:hypothetical protein
MKPITVTLPGPPRTKKNRPNIFPIISAEGIRNLIEKLKRAQELEKGGHREAVRALMAEIMFSVQPSPDYKEWFDEMYLLRNDLVDQCKAAGFQIPFTEPVGIKALFYRDRLTGDFDGYTAALADMIQSDQWRCKACRKKTFRIADCPHCGAKVCFLEHCRKGLGLIQDDKQIAHWDGTRLKKDAINPRVELTISLYDDGRPVQRGLLFEESAVFIAPEPAEEIELEF